LKTATQKGHESFSASSGFFFAATAGRLKRHQISVFAFSNL
jgi:hypothetical protein